MIIMIMNNNNWNKNKILDLLLVGVRTKFTRFRLLIIYKDSIHKKKVNNTLKDLQDLRKKMIYLA